MEIRIETEITFRTRGRKNIKRKRDGWDENEEEEVEKCIEEKKKVEEVREKEEEEEKE